MKCEICGKNDNGNNPCINCSNWKARIKALNEDKENKLIAKKGFKEGQRVLISNASYPADIGKVVGRIYSVDVKKNLFVDAEHYLVDLCSKDISYPERLDYHYPDVSWFYPEDVELLDEDVKFFICKSCNHERIEEDRHDEHICKGCLEWEKEGYFSCWSCWRKHNKQDNKEHKCSICLRNEKEEKGLLCHN